MGEIIVTFHFVSGSSMDVIFSKEQFDKCIKNLTNGWDSCFSIGETYGINFSLVTHYGVKNNGK